MDIRVNALAQKNASSNSKDFFEESKQLVERELTGIREESGSIIRTYYFQIFILIARFKWL